ncbi:MazG family protein [Rarobacter incanus]|uniref:XTP/dITP diphosphohydrolase n=1 Tax=Rarobacter incanus TaxID=153494 RepID=A0A542SPE6_9MICO|nr:MazG family protein [Rarobacter incanus]TQK76490.1 XTP/dITP diphosphohydrolase [Rarobacter incanus]
MPSLFSDAPRAESAVDQLIETVHVLLAPGGCAWDRQQTHKTLAKYLLEESCEAIDAIEAGDAEEVAEELGDVLFQVLFHAEIARRDGEGYDLDSIAAATNEKMRRRHAHVFGDESQRTQDIAEIEASWKRIKDEEKAARTSVLEGVPQSLPALALAAKVISRGESLGLMGDRDSMAASFPFADEREVGRMLLAMTAAARAQGFDPENALRATVRELAGEIRDAEVKLGDAGVIGSAGETGSAGV